MRRTVNRYEGNSGRVHRVPEPGETVPRGEQTPPETSRRPPSPLSGLSGELEKLLGRLSLQKLETDDLLLLLVLYLMYRESRDKELLYILGAMLFL